MVGSARGNPSPPAQTARAIRLLASVPGYRPRRPVIPGGGAVDGRSQRPACCTSWWKKSQSSDPGIIANQAVLPAPQSPPRREGRQGLPRQTPHRQFTRLQPGCAARLPLLEPKRIELGMRESKAKLDSDALGVSKVFVKPDGETALISRHPRRSSQNTPPRSHHFHDHATAGQVRIDVQPPLARPGKPTRH